MVINDIWPEVAFFSLVATMVVLVSEYTPRKLQFSSALLTVLGTVLGLVISFRTSSAYERYQEGRKLWSNITIVSRNLALMFWIHVPTERKGQSAEHKEQATLQAIIEKKTMVNLIQAFAVSLKHFLRGEPGVYYRDLFPLVSFLPRYTTTSHKDCDMLPLWAACHDPSFPLPHSHPHYHPHHENPRETVDEITGTHIQRTVSLPEKHHDGAVSSEDRSQTVRTKSTTDKPKCRKFDPEMALPEIDTAHPIRPARNPPKDTIYDLFPVLRIFKWFGRVIFNKTNPEYEAARQRRKKLDQIESNAPMEIILVLSSYTNFLMTSNLVQPAIATGMTNNITTLQDTLSNLERIRNTPLPFAYQAHLRMSLWLYLFFLPFQIYSAFGWGTIPGTAFASFLLLGFLEIGQEIENPFNYDLNDLDLDHFCLSLQRELHEITAFTNASPHSFIFSPWNQPFAPADRRNAYDLVREHNGEYRIPDVHDGPAPGVPSLRRTLVDSWRTVDEVTRKNH